jgi:acyl-CoA thioesterase-2
MQLSHLFDLEPHGPDTFVGAGPKYPWGGLYGGQIVAQALRAAAATTRLPAGEAESGSSDEAIAGGLEPHSLRAYFIRRGDHTEPVRYEVDRIRNGRSFATRRVVARQAIGAILNLEASFQRPEPATDLQNVPMALDLPSPESLTPSSWSESFDRRSVPAAALTGLRVGTGRTAAWMKVNEPLGDDQLLHRCWMAYLSDDLPSDSVRRALAASQLGVDDAGLDDAAAATYGDDDNPWEHVYSASLDHTIWFHRPVRADEWHLHDTLCHGYVGGRGLTIGHVFAHDGTHVATVAQEVLLRTSARS